MSLPVLADVRIGIIGLGYVGLPLAIYLARHFPVIGFDIDRQRVAELRSGLDRTREVTGEEFARAERIAYAADAEN
jgi:UDP-N-acetyl-D-galactosamine dehydrogenase